MKKLLLLLIMILSVCLTAKGQTPTTSFETDFSSGAPTGNWYDWTEDMIFTFENEELQIAIDRPLPRVGVGDLLVIHDTGAHGHAMGYNYNGKLRSAEILRTEDGEFRLIRRAETPADYFATLDVLGELQPAPRI